MDVSSRKGQIGNKMKTDFQEDPRFAEIRELSPRALLSSPTMHGEELQYMKLAYDTNWMTTLYWKKRFAKKSAENMQSVFPAGRQPCIWQSKLRRRSSTEEPAPDMAP